MHSAEIVAASRPGAQLLIEGNDLVNTAKAHLVGKRIVVQNLSDLAQGLTALRLHHMLDDLI